LFLFGIKKDFFADPWFGFFITHFPLSHQ
jgi:hypothetical protein